MGTNGKACTEFLKWAVPQMGYRWQGYRKVRNQVCKRLKNRMNELDLEDYGLYRNYLTAHPDEWIVLDGMMRITISRFFRDAKSWEVLYDMILSDWGKETSIKKRPLRVWSAGCASGEEPYSFALLWEFRLSGHFPGIETDIVATDASEHMLKRARKACYPRASLRDVPSQMLSHAFKEQPDGMFCLQKKWQKPVKFKKQDIRRRMPGGAFDIVFCKNLVGMYFEPSIARHLFVQICHKIRGGGVLIIGNHEPFPVDDIPGMYAYGPGVNVFRKKLG